MGEAVYGGGSASVVIDGKFFTLHSHVKQYRREYSHEGIYAEATLMVRDEESGTVDDPDRDADERPSDRPRKCCLFCEQGDSGRLFEELDKKTGVPLIPEFQEYVLSEWVKVTKFGFVHRKHARGYLKGLTKKPAAYAAVEAVADHPDGYFPNAGAYRRFPLSTYIKKQMHGKIDGLIVDELHNYNNNSGQGDAMGELFQASRKVVGMTATLINGYSSGIFHLLYRIAPDLMLKDGKRYDRPADFNNEYGVTQSVYEIAAPDYNSNRRTSKRKIREKQLPGVSPLVYSRFLMDSAAFLCLNDMGKNLPEYEEIPVELHMDEAVAQEYYRLEHQFKNILRSQRDISQKVLSAYLGLLTVYPDQPYGHKPVVHPITGDSLIVPGDTSSIVECVKSSYNSMHGGIICGAAFDRIRRTLRMDGHTDGCTDKLKRR